MKDLGIDRGDVHGGDFERRGCMIIMQIDHEFFHKCLQIDKEAVRDKTASVSL